MTVDELIKLLSTVEDKTKDIFFFVDTDWAELPISNQVVENDNRVLLGDTIPPEKYEKDYKCER